MFQSEQSKPFTLQKEAANGFHNASLYDQHRPSYYPDVVQAFLKALEVEGQVHAKIVELGAGTGKFTAPLANREESFEIVAVEPHAKMREGLVGKGLSNVKIVDGNAAKIPLDDGIADAVIAAQAFHWFAADEALREIYRVLTPDGKLGMIWNVEFYNAPESWPTTASWEKKLRTYLYTHEDGPPRFRNLQWKKIFEQQLETTPWQAIKETCNHKMPLFSLPLGENQREWTDWLEDEKVWDRYATLSQIANLEPVEREEVKEMVLRVLKEDDTVRNEKGQIAVKGVTYWAWTTRID